ncbi:uncharacterized protein [Haliotis asinina]|uniref:uncharacterized protein n=1 Tax=Haliotis asinina TaxID=109174 RepID=UPI00353277CC
MPPKRKVVGNHSILKVRAEAAKRRANGIHTSGANPRSIALQISQASKPEDLPTVAASSTTTPHLVPSGSVQENPVVRGESQHQPKQSNRSSTREASVAKPSTVTQAVIEGTQQQGRESNLSSTQEDGLTGPSTDTQVVREGEQQGRQHNPTSTEECGVAGAATDSPAARKVSQQQGRQLSPSSTTHIPVVIPEDNQQQRLQSVSTTTHNYLGSSVCQYDLSNSSQTLDGSPGHRGCLSQASLSIRIRQLNEVFEEVGTLHKTEERLKRHSHVTVCGAPGDGKTSIALKICEKYLPKKYEVLFVDNIEEFQVDTIIQRQCHMLIVFDDIFGSVSFPSNLQKIRKVLTVLANSLVNISVQKEEQDKKKRAQKNMNAGEKTKETLPDADPKILYKLRFIFTSRTYNWNEGCNRLHQFKINLFKLESVTDMTTTTLTTKERESIINSFLKRNQMCDVSSQDKNTITQLHDNMFGFPLICQLYCTNPALQMHNITSFFQMPVTYLRDDLDTIIREGSSRAAALVLLVLCGGKLDLVSFKSGTQCAALFQVVKEEIASCTRTDIGKEIRNFTGTYCTVENHVASFSHPSIHDATACALGHLNEVLLLEHCSLQFLYERVRLNKDDGFQSSHTDDVTNMIYITSNLHPSVITRLVQGVREGCFRWTVGHPVFINDQIAASFLAQIKSDLPDAVHRKDTTSCECFLYWVSISTNHSLFEHVLSLVCREEGLSSSVVTDFYDSIIGCIQTGNLQHLQRLAAVLKQRDRFDVDHRTKGYKTLLMIAAEAGQLDVFNFVLKEGADVSATDNRHCNCLHHSCNSGSKDIVKVLVKQFPHLIDVGDEDGNTPAILCAVSGQMEILKLLVSHKADLTIMTRRSKMNAFHIGSTKGHASVVEYLLTRKDITVDMRAGRFGQTALMMAAERGHYDVYHLLVSEGADLSLRGNYGNDCFMLASKGGNVSIVKHLLSWKKIDINREGGFYERSAVMIAAASGHYDVYHLLVSEGADLSLRDNYRNDCLMLACEGGNVSLVKHLLSLKTFDINRKGGSKNRSAVMMAALNGHYDVYHLLVSEGADLSLTDDDNSDCLMLACEGGNVSIVKHLLSLKTFDINRKGGSKNRSAVMMAALNGHYDVYKLLVSEGADLSLTDRNNSDCLMLACEGGNMSIVKHLLSLKTFDINRRSGTMTLLRTPVMIAIERGHFDIYNLLVSEGADVSLSDFCDMDCLELACESGHISIMEHLSKQLKRK